MNFFSKKQLKHKIQFSKIIRKIKKIIIKVIIRKNKKI